MYASAIEHGCIYLYHEPEPASIRRTNNKLIVLLHVPVDRTRSQDRISHSHHKSWLRSRRRLKRYRQVPHVGVIPDFLALSPPDAFLQETPQGYLHNVHDSSGSNSHTSGDSSTRTVTFDCMVNFERFLWLKRISGSHKRHSVETAKKHNRHYWTTEWRPGPEPNKFWYQRGSDDVDI